MGASNSKQDKAEPLVFYAPSSGSLTITQDLLAEMQGKPQPKAQNQSKSTAQSEPQIQYQPKKSEEKPSLSASEPAFDPDQFERLVSERVKEEVERIQKEEVDILRNVSDERLTDTNYLFKHLEELNQKHQSKGLRELPKDVEIEKEALIACYRNNSKRVLDCWEEVQKFKDAVNGAQQEYIASKN